jgi:SAM-dependent methyltransferase
MSRRAYYDQPSLWARALTPTEEERVRLVQAAWPPGVRTVLDVGCGSGSIANSLSKGARVTGIDLSAEALRHLRHHGVLASAAQCPFRDGSFDLVVCADTLEHLRSGEFESCVDELQRVAARFILVISPSGEDLEANSARCRRCGTVFHMNWHVRSLDQAQVEALFRGRWRLRCFSFFGEKWVRQHSLARRLERSLTDRFPFWEHAVCPLCGSRQGDLWEGPDTGGRTNASAAISEMLSTPGESERDERSEMLLLFERVDSAGRVAAERERDREAAILVCPPGDDDPVTARVVVRDRGSIDMGSPLCVSAVTHIRPDRGYVVVNELTDWGEPYLLDGRWVRGYEDRGGKDGHALFVLPWDIPVKPSLSISYKDTSRESVRVQVYDPERGYLDIGMLPGEATGAWRDATFPLPPAARPGAEGLIGHLVIDGTSHPTSVHPVARIGYVEGRTYTLPLDLRPGAGADKGAWAGNYPRWAADAGSEGLVQLDRPAVVAVRLPGGERYLLGEGVELALPRWLASSFHSGRAAAGRLEAQMADLRQKLAELEREKAELEREKAELGGEKAALGGEKAALEREKAALEATVAEITAQLARANHLSERIAREFRAYQSSIGIREVDQLKRAIGRVVHRWPRHRPGAG